MFNSSIFDIAFGLVSIFLAISLFTSALTEGLSTIIGLRAKTLLNGMKQLLNDKDLNGLTHALYNHALFNPLADGKREEGVTPKVKPSYVEPRHFALALIDTIENAGDTQVKLSEGIDAIEDPQIKATLQALDKRANGDITVFRDQLAGWFDSAMNRLSGSYKRWTKLISFIIALGVAALLNVDVIHVADTLWEHQPVAEQLAKIKMPDKGDGTEGSQALAVLHEIEGAGPLLGWTNFEKDPRRHDPTRFILMLTGWLIAAGAALFGAPFWFDVLQNFVQLRGTGQPPRTQSGAPPAQANASSGQ